MIAAGSLIGSVGLMTLLVVLGFLSRRLGGATRANPSYRGLFLAAGVIAVAAALALVAPLLGDAAALVRLVSTALEAVAVSGALLIGWRYWSWLLAERD